VNPTYDRPVDRRGWKPRPYPIEAGHLVFDGLVFDGLVFDGLVFDGLVFDGLVFDGHSRYVWQETCTFGTGLPRGTVDLQPGSVGLLDGFGMIVFANVGTE